MLSDTLRNNVFFNRSRGQHARIWPHFYLHDSNIYMHFRLRSSRLIKCLSTNWLMCYQYFLLYSASDFSIVAALELYCDKQSQRTLIQSISAAGAIVGVLSVSYISDIKGRRFNMLYSQLIGILSVCCIIFDIE